MASEDRSDIVFSCVLTDELAHCAPTNSFKSVISQMALLNLEGFKTKQKGKEVGTGLTGRLWGVI